MDKPVTKSATLNACPVTSGQFGSFCSFPDKITFEVQHADEHILLLLRQDFIVNTRWILGTIVFALLPVLLPLFPMFYWLPLSFRTALMFGWYVFTFGYALMSFVNWYFNVYIITDERVIDVDFYSLLFKRISETKLEKVEDITASSGGVIQSFFDYGTVNIQTAAEVPEIEFENVPRPDMVTKIISELIFDEGKGQK